MYLAAAKHTPIVPSVITTSSASATSGASSTSFRGCCARSIAFSSSWNGLIDYLCRRRWLLVRVLVTIVAFQRVLAGARGQGASVDVHQGARKGSVGSQVSIHPLSMSHRQLKLFNGFKSGLCSYLGFHVGHHAHLLLPSTEGFPCYRTSLE